MTTTHSLLLLRPLALAILIGLPLLASAQTMRGFSISAPPPITDTTSKFRTVNNPIAGSYIVVLTPSSAKLAGETANSKLPTVAAVADDMTTAYGATLLHAYSHVLRGFAVQANDQSLGQLLADPRVKYVQEDGVVTVAATQTNATWGLDRVDQRSPPLNGTYHYDSVASNVHAYVFDTGLRASHQEFSGRVGNGLSVVPNNPTTNDENGHGTHVAGTLGGTVWGVAKAVKIHPVRVLDRSGSGRDSRTIAAIDWVTANHIKPAVANMSLQRLSSATQESINNMIDAGVVTVVAAGNDGVDACSIIPASISKAITVGATNANDTRASFGKRGASNFGSCLDLFAPGLEIRSAAITSDTDSRLEDGTSMAAPHVAGAAALYLENNPTATPAQVANALINNATPGKVTDPGDGSPNRLLFIPNTPPPNLPLRPGLSGIWYNPNTSGQGMMIEIDAQRSFAFAGWYTYDVNGQPGPDAQRQQRWYSANSNYSPTDTARVMTVYRNTGGQFDNPPTTQGVPIGTATLSFQSCTTGRFDYQINADGENRSGTIPLTRLGTDAYCASGTMPSFSLSTQGINPSLSGAWYEPRTSGQGFQFSFLPLDGNLAFLAWYTYDVNGQSGTGPSGQRWYTIEINYTPGSTQALGMPIMQNLGGRFDTRPPETTSTQVGTADLVIHTCNSASLTYNIAGRPSRTIRLIRLTGGANCSP
jgi:subtilisin family serine protease